MNGQLGWKFVVTLFGLPVLLIASFLFLSFRKRYLMYKLSEMLDATYEPNWITVRGGNYGTVRGNIKGRNFNVRVVGSRYEHTQIQVRCNTPTLAGVLAKREIHGNFYADKVFPDEVLHALRGAFAGQDVVLSETAMVFAKGALSFDGHKLSWRIGGFSLKNPKRFAPMIPLLACIATCLENPDIQRTFIGMNQ